MSKMKAIKTFRYLLSFLTIIPLGKTEDFVRTSAEAMFLFPLIRAFMERVAKSVFGGVSGDMIGATNEVVRATALVFVASVLIL